MTENREFSSHNHDFQKYRLKRVNINNLFKYSECVPDFMI